MCKRYLVFVFTAIFFAGFLVETLSAQNSAENQAESSSSLVFQITTLSEAKLGFMQNFYFPFLQGESLLTEGNNINLALGAELSPISLSGIATAIWTPIAFLELTAGGRIGSGWNAELFGNDVFGIGLNRPDANEKAEHNGNAFDGLLWKAQIGGALQFDLTSIFPGEWNHFVARSYHEINYSGYTRANKNESWYFENDIGENVNGFNYYSNLLIGYQMPIFLKMVALLAEADLYLYDIPNRSQWGDDKLRWTLSGILNFAVHRQFDITMLAQFRALRNYIESDWEELYYQARNINGPSPYRLEFYRLATVLSYKF